MDDSQRLDELSSYIESEVSKMESSPNPQKDVEVLLNKITTKSENLGELNVIEKLDKITEKYFEITKSPDYLVLRAFTDDCIEKLGKINPNNAEDNASILNGVYDLAWLTDANNHLYRHTVLFEVGQELGNQYTQL